jgi:hypothetical protein
MAQDLVSTRGVSAVRTKADGTAIALELQRPDGGVLVVEIPAGHAHMLMRELLGVVSVLPPEDPSSVPDPHAFPVTGYGVGAGFPESVVLALRTPQYGQQGFALDPDTARRIAEELEAQADAIEARHQSPH